MEYILKVFFFYSDESNFWKTNNRYESKFSWLAVLFKNFFKKIKIQPNMSEQEKKRQRIYDLLHAETKPKFLCLPYTKQRKKIPEKGLFKEKGSGRLNEKWKEDFLTALATTIKKDPITAIRKHANDLKVHEKTVQTTINQDLSPDLNPLDYAIWGVLENKTNAISHSNIGSLKTAIEEEWNKMFEEFFLKACKSFRRRVDTIIEKNGGHIE